MVEGLVLMNVNPCAEGWMDWAASKVRLGRAGWWGPSLYSGLPLLDPPSSTFLTVQESNLPQPCSG